MSVCSGCWRWRANRLTPGSDHDAWIFHSTYGNGTQPPRDRSDLGASIVWSLFPRSWFKNSQPTESKRAGVVGRLDQHWSPWLSAALSRALNEVVPPDLAAARLGDIDARHLLSIDQALRSFAWDCDAGWPQKGVARLMALSADRSNQEAYLFTAGCNGNGFVRQQALVALMAYPGRLALALALIRCDDWAFPVQETAAELLSLCLREAHPSELVSLLDLILVLRGRRRASELWRTHIEPSLADERCRSILWDKARTGVAATRLLCLELIVRMLPDQRLEACRIAISDADPRIGRWALANAFAPKPSEWSLEVVSCGLQHPGASVRSKALHLAAKYALPDLRGALERAVFDLARAPRDTAAHWLRALEFGDPVGKWRDELDAATTSAPAAAIFAISERATREDAPRLLRWIDHPRTSIRAAALQGLSRAQDPQLSGHLRRALHDPSPKVAKLAILFGRSLPDVVSLATFRDLYATADSDRLRQLLIRSLGFIDKWDGMLLILEWGVDADAELVRSLTQGLDRWRRDANKRFSPLRPSTRLDLLTLLDGRNQLPAEQLRLFRGFVMSA